MCSLIGDRTDLCMGNSAGRISVKGLRIGHSRFDEAGFE